MEKTRQFRHVWVILALLGAVLYIAKSFYFAHSSLSIGDEGAYLFKGLMFARGEYRPFQDYGFWTNKAPLAFLIPGYAQYWFGAGLREGRYFAILASVFMLAGLWITANRLGGKGWAALGIWIFALSDAHVATYSQALSQGLVACMMSWMFVCTLGGDRPLWQLLLGSALSVFTVMTRQNMILVPPLLILFITWQYGWRKGGWAFLVGVALFVAFHILYWPQIMQMWVTWLPQEQTPFLDDFRVFASSTGTFQGPDGLSRWQAFAIGVRDHFFLLCGAVAGAVLWARRDAWKNSKQFKMAVFLGILYLGLLGMHAWGSLFNDFCALCFTSYQMFFSLTGFLFIVVVFKNKPSDSAYRLPALAACLLFFSAVLGLYYFPVWGDPLLDSVQLPRLSPLREEGRIDFVSLREVLTYRFQMGPDRQKRFASAGMGLLGGAALLLLAWVSFRRFRVLLRGADTLSINQWITILFLGAGTLILPATEGIRYSLTGCSTNFLAYYEQAGRALADIIPPDNLVYWKGSGRQLALLLYEDDFRYFPPQITAGGGYLIGDSDHLLRFGMYNEELDNQWKESADIFLIWRFFPTVTFEEFQDQTRYEAIPFEMGGIRMCEDPLYIFVRRP